jgi:hypothetical protein
MYKNFQMRHLLVALSFLFVLNIGVPPSFAAEAVDSPYDAIGRAHQEGEISLKDAVLQKADLLFGAQPSAKAAQQSGGERCLTGFYKEFHQIVDELSDQEKAVLGRLNPDMRAILKARETQLLGIAAGVAALPDFPDLDAGTEGVSCYVHYTLTGANKVPNDDYPEAVAKYIDEAVSKEGKDFRKALPEHGGDGKLHVYVTNTGAPGIYGAWVDVDSGAPGKQRTGYIKINPTSAQGVDLKLTCYHEYFHGVQSAYNWNSSLWFMEATCTWVENYYAKNSKGLVDAFSSPSSIFNSSHLPLSDNTFHKYSTVAYAYYLYDKYGGINFLKDYFTATVNADDAIPLIDNLLKGKGTSFEADLPLFWMALYQKNIKSIKKLMPSVKLYTTENSYEYTHYSYVSPTASLYYAFVPEADIPNATFMARSKASATGKPRAIMFKEKDKTPAFLNDNVVGFFSDFGKKNKKVILIAYDAAYTTEADTATREAYLTVQTPYVKVKSIAADSPLYAPGSSQIAITYDLLGVDPDPLKLFTVQLKITEKGPDVSDSASGPTPMTPGENQTYDDLWFNVYNHHDHGTYKFKFRLSVPDDTLGMPQVYSEGSCSVVVIGEESGSTYGLRSRSPLPIGFQPMITRQ